MKNRREEAGKDGLNREGETGLEESERKLGEAEGEAEGAAVMMGRH